MDRKIAKQGWMTKVGGKFKTWTNRYFVLKQDVLSYYKNQSLKERRGTLVVRGATILALDPDDTPKPYAIGVIQESDPTRVYIFVAEDEEDHLSWLDALHNAAASTQKQDSLREGIMFKLGDERKRWSQRFVVLTSRTLRFYLHKGARFPVAEVCLLFGGKVMANTSEQDLQGHSFGMKLTPTSLSRRHRPKSTSFAASSDGEREVWIQQLSTVLQHAPKIESNPMSSTNSHVEDKAQLYTYTHTRTKSGWLRKQGHLMPSWKKRFVVLSGNLLSYFKTDADATPQGMALGRRPVGTLSVFRADVQDEPGCSPSGFYFSVVVLKSRRKYLFRADSTKEVKEWVRSLQMAAETQQQSSEVLDKLEEETSRTLKIEGHSDSDVGSGNSSDAHDDDEEDPVSQQGGRDRSERTAVAVLGVGVGGGRGDLDKYFGISSSNVNSPNPVVSPFSGTTGAERAPERGGGQPTNNSSGSSSSNNSNINNNMQSAAAAALLSSSLLAPASLLGSAGGGGGAGGLGGGGGGGSGGGAGGVPSYQVGGSSLAGSTMNSSSSPLANATAIPFPFPISSTSSAAPSSPHSRQQGGGGGGAGVLTVQTGHNVPAFSVPVGLGLGGKEVDFGNGGHHRSGSGGIVNIHSPGGVKQPYSPTPQSPSTRPTTLIRTASTKNLEHPYLVPVTEYVDKSSTMEGWLLKLGRAPKAPRVYCIVKEEVLSWYSDVPTKGGVIKGHLNMRGCELQREDCPQSVLSSSSSATSSSSILVAFAITPPHGNKKRRYVFVAQHPVELDLWILALQKQITEAESRISVLSNQNLKEGYLMWLGKDKAWHKMYFALTDQCTLKQFESHKAVNSPTRVLGLYGMSIQLNSTDKYDRETFAVGSSNVEWVLSADNRQDLNDWVTQLSKIVASHSDEDDDEPLSPGASWQQYRN